MLYCNITSRVPGAKDQDLRQEKGGRIFPFMAFMDAEGALLARHEAARTVDGFEQTAGKARAFLDLKARASGGGPSDRIDLVIAQLDLGHLTQRDAEARILETGATPTEEQRKRLEGVLANSEIESLLAGERTAEAVREVAAKCYERHKAGKAAPAAGPLQWDYWNRVLMQAEWLKDASAFEEALRILLEKFGEVLEVKKYLQEKGAKLRELKP